MNVTAHRSIGPVEPIEPASLTRQPDRGPSPRRSICPPVH